MSSTDLEEVGSKFEVSVLDRCQERSWQLLFAIKEKIEPGMTEPDAQQIAKDLYRQFEVEKSWHPTKIRFGTNTLKTFREPSDETVILKPNDIYFLDLGPSFFEHEGDVGDTFTVGQFPEAQSMADAGRQIWKDVRKHWQTGVTGEQLYLFAEITASKYGYQLSNGGYGHRTGDFPHAIFHRGALKAFDKMPTANRWILEIQLRHPTLPIGSFYEDILR